MRKSREDSINSQKYIMEALNALLHEQRLQDITVTDICKKAGVARVTFYKYYSTIYDVMRATVDEKVEQFSGKIANLDPHSDLQRIIEYVIEVLDYSEGILKNIINSNMSGILLDYINYGIEMITEEDVKNNKISRTQVLFLSGGIFNIIHDWIKRGSKESPQLLAQELIKLIPPSTLQE
ncbi:TetR/AcrR family transcriptional regulator [Cytobacillus gottheilii]|uniref:TetR/AcrR family transcriptional regulator n=1 Tax=Cytobacillus gottheilii TaxID=859144 RepID=UPI0009BBB711|nr:TetR/AcrR family transcriptional regulator [Cytobacillus gottheilii]